MVPPHSAPTTASASADSNALIIFCSSCRIKSGDASASASASTVPGSTMCGAVIVLMPFERVVRDSSKDHTVTASTSSPTPLATERYTTMRDSTTEPEVAERITQLRTELLGDGLDA